MTAQQDTVDHRIYKRGMRRADRGTNTKYDDKDKYFALAVFAETNSIVTASKRTLIPETTIHYWIHQPESDSLIEELRTALKSKIAFTLAEGALLAAEGLFDRIKNGDIVIINNEICRAPIKAKDLGYVLNVLTERHALYNASIAGKNSKDMLTNLATELVNKMRQITEPKVIEQESDTRLT